VLATSNLFEIVMVDIIETVITMVIIKIVVTVTMIAMIVIGGVEPAPSINCCNWAGWNAVLALT